MYKENALEIQQSSYPHERDGQAYVWSVEKSNPVFTQYTSFQAKKMLQGGHCYSCAAQLPEVALLSLSSTDQADVPMAEAGNDQRGLAHRVAFTLQHFN
ncbi:unnamed protein product [Oncorhynchus mykiss]|uniref:Uncharacterized protein n=1 Tax=Oncorhynchus mykiss TaxID=8022 RepID=A0A060XWM8_ONCMY|nr:unnamed protein product [Oncorhynchus mykiss]